ncbi:MAG TPA: HD domain-containing phosphohydrolase [Actinomycetes bacterium]|nr:HD domain-containing phosphohydrolase [Actinomycetes bacterium]
MTRESRSGSVARTVPDQGLLAAFRVLAAGEDPGTAGPTLLERACAALEAEEGAILLAGPDTHHPGPPFAPGQHHGSPSPDTHHPGPPFAPGQHHGSTGPGGRIGTRECDPLRWAGALAAGHPVAAGGPAPELWCPMVVEGRPVGVLAVRRDRPAPFTPADHAAIEILAIGAAVAADRLRFLRLWSDKLDQADAVHSQLLRYADDLRTTWAAERRQAEDLREALAAVEHAYSATVRALATAVEAKDAYTGGHLTRVTAYGVQVCKAIGGSLPATPGLEHAFLLHDLGKIGVPDAVLNKAGPLTDEEWVLMREHPAIGMRILDGVPQMDVVREVVYCHHERWDGAGYPEGLKGEAIPLAARVFAAVDAFDAMTTDRPYRRASGLDEALSRLRAASGTQFAPDAVDAMHLVDREELQAIQATAVRRR